jgi:hypothetical protein
VTARRCTIHGHHHNTWPLRTVVQDGTGELAHWSECPTGRYRFFHIELTGHTARFDRPRHGWTARHGG